MQKHQLKQGSSCLTVGSVTTKHQLVVLDKICESVTKICESKTCKVCESDQIKSKVVKTFIR